MQCDQTDCIQGPLQVSGRLARDVGVRGAMKTVAAHVVGMVPGVRYRVAICVCGQALVKGGIEHRHLRHLREEPQADLDAGQIGRVMQRGERAQHPQCLDNLGINQRWRAESLAAMHNPMSDAIETEFSCRPRFPQQCQDLFESLCMVGHGQRPRDFLAHAVRVLPIVEESTLRLTDAIQAAATQYLSVRHVDDAVLNGGTSGIDDQNVHAPAARSCAWMAVIATVLTISATVQPRLRSLTGLLRPCSTGPMATAFAERCTAL